MTKFKILFYSQFTRRGATKAAAAAAHVAAASHVEVAAASHVAVAAASHVATAAAAHVAVAAAVRSSNNYGNYSESVVTDGNGGVVGSRLIIGARREAVM
jgi:vacuolar-type H+-ATPase subunit B/Vma2